MNVEAPDLKQLSAEALRDLLNNLTQAKGFILEQAPDFCQQLVARGLWVNAITGATVLAAGIGLAVAGLWAFRIGAHEAKKDILKARDSVIAPCFLGGGGAIVTGIVALIGGLQHCREALSVYIAPKVFLVEEITRMIR